MSGDSLVHSYFSGDLRLPLSSWCAQQWFKQKWSTAAKILLQSLASDPDWDTSRHLQQMTCSLHFFLSSCRARSRLWRSSKHLWLTEEEALLAQGKRCAKNPGAIPVNRKTTRNKKPPNKTKRKPPPRMHPGDRWNGETPRPYPLLSAVLLIEIEPPKHLPSKLPGWHEIQMLASPCTSRQYQCCHTVAA